MNLIQEYIPNKNIAKFPTSNSVGESKSHGNGSHNPWTPATSWLYIYQTKWGLYVNYIYILEYYVLCTCKPLISGLFQLKTS